MLFQMLTLYHAFLKKKEALQHIRVVPNSGCGTDRSSRHGLSKGASDIIRPLDNTPRFLRQPFSRKNWTSMFGAS